MMSEGDAVRSMEARERIAEAREQELGIKAAVLEAKLDAAELRTQDLFTVITILARAANGYGD